MAHSIEMRVPFVDLEFLRLVERLPSRLKLRGLTGKYVWKRAARRWLPAEIVTRPKRGFATPIDDWFRGTLSTFVRDTLLSRHAAERGYFDPRVVAQLIVEHERGRHDRRRQLFSLLAFELWHQQFVDDAGLAARLTAIRSGVARLD
jgi:asparagine synthase (glutamine-hydrolysing)